MNESYKHLNKQAKIFYIHANSSHLFIERIQLIYLVDNHVEEDFVVV
jgi:hypothetical protein